MFELVRRDPASITHKTSRFVIDHWTRANHRNEPWTENDGTAIAVASVLVLVGTKVFSRRSICNSELTCSRLEYRVKEGRSEDRLTVTIP